MTKEINLNIYVIHYTKLTNRSKTIDNIKNTFHSLEKQFTNLHTNVKIVESFEPEMLQLEFVKRIFDVNDLTEPDNVFFNKFKIANPTTKMISNCLKHLDAIKSISLKNDTDVNLILEDDVFYNEKFSHQIEEFVRMQLYLSFDMIFFGFPGDKPTNYVDGGVTSVTEYKLNGSSVFPCCDSYYINSSTAKKITSQYTPIKYPHNIQLSYLTDKLNIKIGRTYPNLMVDGSKIGFTSSTISPNNILLFNNAYKLIYKLLEKPDMTAEDIQTIKKAFESNTIENNPDFIFLEGLFNFKLKNYKTTQELFDKAISEYEEQHSPLNNQSAIIQNYIELAKYLQ